MNRLASTLTRRALCAQHVRASAGPTCSLLGHSSERPTRYLRCFEPFLDLTGPDVSALTRCTPTRRSRRSACSNARRHIHLHSAQRPSLLPHAMRRCVLARQWRTCAHMDFMCAQPFHEMAGQAQALQCTFAERHLMHSSLSLVVYQYVWSSGSLEAPMPSVITQSLMAYSAEFCALWCSSTVRCALNM